MSGAVLLFLVVFVISFAIPPQRVESMEQASRFEMHLMHELCASHTLLCQTIAATSLSLFSYGVQVSKLERRCRLGTDRAHCARTMCTQQRLGGRG